MTQSSIDTGTEDVVRRGIKLALPCKLTRDELYAIARQRAAKEAELKQLEADRARDAKKRKEQIREYAHEIEKMRLEIYTGEQERTVVCTEVFRRALDGTPYIHTIRNDTADEVKKRPASPQETNLYLPGTEPPSLATDDDARGTRRKRKRGGAGDDRELAGREVPDVPDELAAQISDSSTDIAANDNDVAMSPPDVDDPARADVDAAEPLAAELMPQQQAAAAPPAAGTRRGSRKPRSASSRGSSTAMSSSSSRASKPRRATNR